MESASDPVLTAYRHVLENDSAWDGTGLEKLARRNHDENPREFEKRYRELESEERSLSSPAAVVLAEDAGVGRLEGLLDKLIREAVGEEA